MYIESEWKSLTADNIDWSRWDETDESVSIQLPIPVDLSVLDAIWTELMEASLPLWLYGSRKELASGWIQYEIYTRIFTGSTEIDAWGFIELQDRGNQKTILRLWKPSVGPNGSG